VWHPIKPVFRHAIGHDYLPLLHQQFSFWRKPKEQGHPTTQTREEVSRNDATAQRKSLFVAPLRRCVRLSLPLILGRSLKLKPE